MDNDFLLKKWNKFLSKWKEEGGLSNEFTPLEKAILYWYSREGDDSQAFEAYNEFLDMGGSWEL